MKWYPLNVYSCRLYILTWIVDFISNCIYLSIYNIYNIIFIIHPKNPNLTNPMLGFSVDQILQCPPQVRGHQVAGVGGFIFFVVAQFGLWTCFLFENWVLIIPPEQRCTGENAFRWVCRCGSKRWWRPIKLRVNRICFVLLTYPKV